MSYGQENVEANARLCGLLAECCDFTEALFQEHIATYGELLPHVFLGEVTPWFEVQALNGEVSDDAASVVNLLESTFTAGQEQNFIAVSFLENLTPEDGESARLIAKALPPDLRIVYKADNPSYFHEG